MRLAAMLIFFLITSQAFSQDIGVQLYSFRNQFKTDVPGTLDKIKSMGITKLEGGDSYGMSVIEFSKLLEARKMKVVSVGADFNKLKTDIYSVIGNAKAFGAKYVVCFWIPHNGDDFTVDDAKNAVEVFNAAGKILRENGLNFCYHPHGYEFRAWENETLFDYIMTRTNPAYVNFEMDVFWIKQPGQDPVSLLKKYPGRFQLMHLKDRKPGTPNSQNGHADVESNVVLGSGDVGIGEIMKVAKKSGVKHFFIEDESSRSLEQVPQSLVYLKSLK
jgi:sugar phosphate isomerase/epimerase